MRSPEGYCPLARVWAGVRPSGKTKPQVVNLRLGGKVSGYSPPRLIPSVFARKVIL